MLAHLLTPPFLCIYSTKIFLRISDTSISTYLLNQNILVHLWHLHFYVSTQPKYSCAPPTPPFLLIYSTKIYLRIPNTTISTYLLEPNRLYRWLTRSVTLLTLQWPPHLRWQGWGWIIYLKFLLRYIWLWNKIYPWKYSRIYCSMNEVICGVPTFVFFVRNLNIPIYEFK